MWWPWKSRRPSAGEAITALNWCLHCIYCKKPNCECKIDRMEAYNAARVCLGYMLGREPTDAEVRVVHDPDFVLPVIPRVEDPDIPF